MSIKQTHFQIASSFEYDWDGVKLVLEREVRAEINETEMDFLRDFHFITIALANFQANYKTSNGSQRLNYQAGDIVILPQTELLPHLEIDREVPLLQLYLNPKHVELLAPTKQLEPQMQVRDPLIEQMGMALYRELQASGAAGAMYAESMSIALSAHLIQNYSAARLKPIAGLLSARDTQLVKDYINNNLNTALTVAELSQVVQISIHHFAILFRRTFGLTPHQYVLKLRIDRAMVLLKTTKQPIVTIAHQVGFNTQSHFTRIFQQHTQFTPKQYRDYLR
jgi:AraC family transcriptional regulator